MDDTTQLWLQRHRPEHILRLKKKMFYVELRGTLYALNAINYRKLLEKMARSEDYDLNVLGSWKTGHVINLTTMTADGAAYRLRSFDQEFS